MQAKAVFGVLLLTSGVVFGVCSPDPDKKAPEKAENVLPDSPIPPSLLPWVQVEPNKDLLARPQPWPLPRKKHEKEIEAPSEQLPLAFWRGIADNTNVDAWRRGIAIHKLFEQHVPHDVTLGKLAEILSKPTWIKPGDVRIVTKSSGAGPPVERTADGTLFRFVIFANENLQRHNKECFGLCLNVTDEFRTMKTSELIDALMGREGSGFKDRQVKQWGFSFHPSWPLYLQRGPEAEPWPLPRKKHEKEIEAPFGHLPLAFWQGIADNTNVDVWRRGIAIYKLFEQHVPPDVTVGKLAEILNKPSWIKATNARNVMAGSGLDAPVKRTSDANIFLLVIFRNENIQRHNKECFGLYLNVTGDCWTKGPELIETLMGREGASLKDRKVKEWGFHPSWPEYLKRGAEVTDGR